MDDKSIYDLNIFSLLGTIFPSLRHLRDDVDKQFAFISTNHPWLFCSEIICIIYKKLGLLDNDIDTQAYLPVDFMNPKEHNKVNSIMKLPPVFLKQIHVPGVVEVEKKICVSLCGSKCNIL